MSGSGRALRLLAVLAALALGACAARPPRELPDAGRVLLARAALIQSWPAWSFEGRIAVRDGKEGGSGRIHWREGGGRYEIALRAPVSAKTWVLSGDSAQSELHGVAPQTLRGLDPAELLARGTGWHLPVAHARSWVRGLALEPGKARLGPLRDGLPHLLEEDGWAVEFREWAPAVDGRPPMPKRIIARRAPWEVRLAIARETVTRARHGGLVG